MNDEWLTRELRATVRCHQALLHATDEQELLDDICRIICDDAGYALAWVGFAVDDDTKSVAPVAFAGNEQGYLSEVDISWGDTNPCECPAGASIRTARQIYVDDFSLDPSVARWAEAAVTRGFVGCMGLPLIGDNGAAFGSLAVYASAGRRFDADEQELLQGFAADLAFGINALRRRAAARRQNELFRAAWETSPDAMLITTVADGTISDVNQGFEELFGWKKAEVLGRSVTDIQFWANPTDRGELLNQLKVDGARMFGVIQDISDRERVNRELQESEARYRSISDTVTSFVYSCVQELGEPYRMDWIAGAVESLTGFPTELFNERGCWHFIVDPDDLPLFEQGVSKLPVGQAATVDLRLVRADGTSRWVRSSATTSAMPEIPGGVRIVGSVEDITEKRQAESDLIATNARLEGVLKSLTETMAKVVEARDPYAEGHERGVARIARQIAQRMGMAPDEIEGIEVAANLHDVGKLAIPAEILSKPSKLSDIEWEFVKQHAHAGHDILHGIDFGWPVAQMALQHHERMDGSGYPAGLAGDEILMGARVIMVADVVDAMSCHRPYRPSLGLDAAISEIASNPAQYDPAVVEALLSLYEEGLIEVGVR